MGLFSFIGSVLGGNAQKKGVDQATRVQVDAFNRGIDLQQAQYDQTRADYAPYLAVGTAALGRYGNLTGLNGADAQGQAVAGLKADPFFQQNLADANTNLLQQASATGGVRGGDTAGAIGQLSPALLQSYYQQALNSYGGLASLGLGAQGSVTGAGLANANAATSLNANIGQAQAGRYLTRAGIKSAAWMNGGKLLDEAANNALGFAFPGLNGITKGGTLATNTAAQNLIRSNGSIF